MSYSLCSGLAAGMAIGIVGDAGVRAVGQQDKIFVGMILILIFAEALGMFLFYIYVAFIYMYMLLLLLASTNLI